MAKRKRTLAKPPQRMTKRERTRWQKERRIQRNLILIFVAVGVVSILVLAYGVYREFVAIPGEVIARVNGEPILRSDYWAGRRLQLVTQVQQQESQYDIYMQMGITLTKEQDMKFQRDLREILLSFGRVRQEPLNEDLMQELIRDEVLIQGTQALGIDPTDAEVDAWLFPDAQPETSPFETFPLTETVATPTPASTLSPAERQSLLVERLTVDYNRYVEYMREFAAGDLGFSLQDYITMMRRSLRIGFMQEKVQEQLAGDLPKTEEQVLASHILIQERQAQTLQAEQALEQGDSFARAVVRYSDDEATRDRAGDLGWLVQGEGLPSPAVEAAAFAITETDGLGPVVEDEAGYHILQLLERSEDGTQVHVRHILLPADRRAEAEDVLELAAGGDIPFDQLAMVLSEDKATASQGGDLGWLTQGGGLPSPQVEEAAFALITTNPLSEIVEDEAGYHILQFVERSGDGSQVYVRHVLILRGADFAEDLRGQIVSRVKDFSEAVVDHSIDEATVELAGELGWVRQGDGVLSPALEAAAFAITETGGISPIIEEDDGWYILQLVEQDEVNQQVHLRQIQVKRADRLSQDVLDYIEAEPGDRSARFLRMALRYSDEEESRANGGDLDWFDRDRYLEIEDMAFSMEVGSIERFEGKSGWHILWVRDYDVARPLDQETLDQQAQQAFEGWLDQRMKQAAIERYPPPTATPTLPVPSLPPVTTAPITGTVAP